MKYQNRIELMTTKLIFDIPHVNQFGEALVVLWLSPYERDTVTRVQIVDKAVYILHDPSTLGKGVHPNCDWHFAVGYTAGH